MTSGKRGKRQGASSDLAESRDSADVKRILFFSFDITFLGNEDFVHELHENLRGRYQETMKC